MKKYLIFKKLKKVIKDRKFCSKKSLKLKSLSSCIVKLKVENFELKILS